MRNTKKLAVTWKRKGIIGGSRHLGVLALSLEAGSSDRHQITRDESASLHFPPFLFKQLPLFFVTYVHNPEGTYKGCRDTG